MYLQCYKSYVRSRILFDWQFNLNNNSDCPSDCSSCTVCQLRAPVKVSDRVPITPISRNNELPFNHLVMDCKGTIVPEGDSALPKPEFNYALVIVDRFSRWPLCSLSAKAVVMLCYKFLWLFPYRKWSVPIVEAILRASWRKNFWGD